jgi:hydrogenase nickel incorporation protein HypB
VTEGDDKPAKYPVMFRGADLVLLSKADLLDVLDDFDPAKAEQAVRNLANPAPVVELSAKRADSLAPWLNWLDEQIARRKNGEELRPKVQKDGVDLHAAE